jgi:hypothetical protein
MQTLANIVFGGILAGLSLGPAAWTDAAQAGAQLSRTVAFVAGTECAGSQLSHAVAKARAALPELPNGAH